MLEWNPKEQLLIQHSKTGHCTWYFLLPSPVSSSAQESYRTEDAIPGVSQNSACNSEALVRSRLQIFSLILNKQKKSRSTMPISSAKFSQNAII